MSFSVDGLDYEIDLGPANRQRLHEDLQPFTNAGRDIGQHKQSRAPSSQADLAEIRAWALAHGLHVPERGRICASVVSRYDAAHQRGLSVKTARSLQKATTGKADGIAQPHVIKPPCPLTCIEDLLPARSFIALDRHLRGEEHFVHPLVSDVVDLYQRTGLAAVRGLGAQGIELTTTLLESAGLVRPRPGRPGQQSKLELMKRLAL